MLNVTEATKNAYLSDSDMKSVTITVPNKNITFTNVDLISESPELEEKLEVNRNLQFKGCNASKFKFTVAEVVTDLRGQYIEATIQAGNTEVIPIFQGYIDSQNSKTSDDVETEFIAYDKLNKVGDLNMQSWIDSITFPISVKAFRDSLFYQLNITQEPTTLVNDGLYISENVKNYLENPTAIELMRWICELNARFGQIGRYGQFKYVKLWMVTEGLYPGDDTFPSDETFPSAENASDTISVSQYETIEYQPYETTKISKISIYDQEGINQGNYGSGSNVWSISDNPLAFSVNMQTAARNLYDEVSPLSHIPVLSLNCNGRPWLECGDIISTATRTNIVRTYILNRTLKGIQALFDTFSSDNDKDMPPVKSTATSRINSNKKSVLEIQADIVQMNEAIIQRATIEQLNATNANVQNLTARVATVETLDAQKATIQQLNAVSASVNNLSAIAITTQNLSAQTINASQIRGLTITASQITSGTISADRLSADTIRTKFIQACAVSPLQGQIDIGTVRAGSVKIYNNGYHTLNLNTRRIGNVDVKIVEWS